MILKIQMRKQVSIILLIVIVSVLKANNLASTVFSSDFGIAYSNNCDLSYTEQVLKKEMPLIVLTGNHEVSSSSPSGRLLHPSKSKLDRNNFKRSLFASNRKYKLNLFGRTVSGSTVIPKLKVYVDSTSITNATICQGESYLFNAVAYFKAGDWTVINLKTANGKNDSTATLHLTVNLPTSSVSKDTICQGTSYLFNGTNYDKEGEYIVHLTNIAGCDSTATLVLAVNHTSSTLIIDSICEGRTFSFNGSSYTLPGLYTVHLTNVVGCDSTVQLNLKVIKSTSSTSYAAICAGGSYTFNGTSYSKSGTYSSYFPKNTGCDSIAKLVLTVLQFSSLTYASICEGENYFFNGKKYNTSGIDSTFLTSVVGCDSIAILHLTVNQPSNSITYSSICSGDSYTFNGTNYISEGTYKYHLINRAGCDSIASLVLTVKQPSSSITLASICLGESYDFNGISYISEATYTSHLINVAGCDSITTLVLTVKQPSSSITQASICFGESYTFNGTTYTTGATYSSHLINIAGCDSIATLMLSVKNPSSSISQFSICAGVSYNFNGISCTKTGIYTTHFTNAVGCDSTAILKLTVIPKILIQLYDTIYQNQSFSNYGFSIPTQTIRGDFVFYKYAVTVYGCDSVVKLNLNVSSNFLATVRTPPSICANDKNFTLSLDIVRGQIEFCSVVFDQKAQNAGFTDIIKQMATGLYIDVPLPSNVRPDYYTALVLLDNGLIRKSFSISFVVNYSSAIILQKWNDVLALYNSDYNGGYEFKSYQWYKDGISIDGETKSYFYLSKSNFDAFSEYSVKLTRVSDAVVLFTCPMKPTKHAETNVYPTLLSQKSQFMIHVSNSAKALLMNISGFKLKEQLLNIGDNSMLTPDVSGTYVLLLIDDQGQTKQQILIVK